jgi:hypothetical protein
VGDDLSDQIPSTYRDIHRSFTRLYGEGLILGSLLQFGSTVLLARAGFSPGSHHQFAFVIGYATMRFHSSLSSA